MVEGETLDFDNDETSPLLTSSTHRGIDSSFHLCRRTSQQRPEVVYRRPRSSLSRIIVRTLLIAVLAVPLTSLLLLQFVFGDIGLISNHFRSSQTSKNESTNETSSSSLDDRSTSSRQNDVPSGTKKKYGFHSYRSYAGMPYRVSYDQRSIMLDGERSLFIGGSMHPIRATRDTWETALDTAVIQGLNLITIYVMWSAHQPFPDSPFDWSIGHNQISSSSSSSWSLAEAIHAVADHGLFVHIRIGPYVCAEYSYGGIPEWVPLVSKNNNTRPEMAMRRANIAWMDAMENYLRNVVGYLQDHKLFAYQGGPIILAQIENELGEDELTPERKDLWSFVDRHGRFVVTHSDDAAATVMVSDNDDRATTTAAARHRRATIQDYADWCGRIAHALEPNVIWTMCNGLSAKDTTIETYNGFLETTGWLESHGDNGRVQIDQPALWTEDEGGFQIWGDKPNHPSDYVWGVTARSMSYTALRWFARGGCHLNFYMWWGGYNRGRSAAGGITNLYALESSLCPSGEPRYPKFTYLQHLISSIVAVAPVLLQSSSALDRPEPLDVRQDDGSWWTNNYTLAFRYHSDEQEVVIVDNANGAPQDVRITFDNATEFFHLESYSAILIVNRKVVFDSAFAKMNPMPLQRLISEIPSAWLRHHSWSEVLCISDVAKHAMQATPRPVEQTELNMETRVWSDYVRYYVRFYIEEDVADSAFLQIESVEAMAFTVHFDAIYVGSVASHKHSEGPVVYSVPVPSSLLRKGDHWLVIVSESLGYGNLVGRWGSGTTAKTKGLTGNVELRQRSLDNNSTATIANLTDGSRMWSSEPGLTFDPSLSHHPSPPVCQQHDESETDVVNIGRWTEFQFLTPRYENSIEKLYIDIRQGRGHFWLNGHDLGRYWNITEDDEETRRFSQVYYQLPHDLLQNTTGNKNRLIMFDGLDFGVDDEPITVRLVTSHVGPSEAGSSIFPDQVGFDRACLRR